MRVLGWDVVTERFPDAFVDLVDNAEYHVPVLCTEVAGLNKFWILSDWEQNLAGGRVRTDTKTLDCSEISQRASRSSDHLEMWNIEHANRVVTLGTF